MNNFLIFTTSSVKSETVDVANVVDAEKLKFLLSKPGFYIDRVENFISAILPIIKKMDSDLPKIQAGPVPSLQVDYTKISGLSEFLTAAVEEIDKDEELDLQSSELIIEGSNHLGQFCQYIPYLISPTAPSMSSYIESLQQSLSLVTETLDKVIEIMGKCKEKAIADSESVSFDDLSFAKWRAACSYLCQQQIIDLYFILGYESIPANQQTSIQEYIKVIEQLLQSLLDAQNMDALLPQMSKIVTDTPSLICLYGSVRDVINEESFMAPITARLVHFLSFILEVTNKKIVDEVTENVKKIPNLLSEEEPDKAELKKVAEAIVKRFNEFATADYITNQKEAELLSKEIKEAIENEGSTAFDIANAVISAAKFIGYSILSLDCSKKILDETNSAIIDLLNMHLVSLKMSAESIELTYTDNINIFKESSLGQLNYHLQIIKNMKSFDQNDSDCMKNITRVCASAATIPEKTEKITDVCDDELKATFNQIIEKVASVSDSFFKWYSQILSSASTTVLESAQEISESVIYTLQEQKEGVSEETKKCIANARKISEDLKNEPLFIATNAEKAVKLTESLNAFSKIETEGEDVPIKVKLCNQVIQHSSEFKPIISTQIANAFVPDDVFDFVSVSSSIIKRILPMIQSTQRSVDESVSSSFKTVYDAMTSLCAILNNSPSQFKDFKQLPESINTSLGMILPLAMDYQQANAQNIQNYMASLYQLISEFDSTAESFTPFVEVDIPQEIRIFRTLEASTNSLTSSILKNNAVDMLNTFKDLKTPSVIKYISDWFELANEEYIDLEKASDHLLSQDIDSPDLISALAKMAMAVTKSMENMDPEVADFVEKKVAGLSALLRRFFETPNEEDLNLIKANYATLANTQKLKGVTEEEKENMLNILISNSAIKLDELRKDKNGVVPCINYLLNLDTFLYFHEKDIYPELNELLAKFAKEIASGNSEGINAAIQKLAEYLRKYLPDRYNEFVQLRDGNVICDIAYNRSETLRDCTNVILREVKQGTLGSEVINNVIARISTLAYESATVTLQSLINEGLTGTTAVKTYAESINEIFTACNEFGAYAKSMSACEDVASLTRNLRKASRTMAKRIDGFINHIETPPKAEVATDFEAKKMQFIYALSEVSLQCGRVISRLDAAPVKEIIEPEKEVLKQSLNEKAELLKSAYEAVVADAVGPNIEEFNESYQKYMEMIEKTLGNLLEEEPYDAKNHAYEACSFAPNLIAAVSALNSELITLPDPIEAAKLPDEFVLPPLPTEAPSPEEAYEQLKKAAELFENEVDKTKAKCDESPNNEIVEETHELVKAAHDFATTCSVMAAATIDTRMQVEQQTTTHRFAGTVNQMIEAIRAKLMLAPNAEADISECISGLHSVTKKLVQLGEESSKYQPPQQKQQQQIVQEDEQDQAFEDDDEVTAELNATASAIEEMAARLATFSAQFGDSAKEAEVNDEDDDDSDDENSSDDEQRDVTFTDLGDFPSFVISQAQTILRAAGQMVKRATQITRDLVAQLGHLSNERMLISLAQELTDDAGLILICAEMLINGSAGEDPEFKVIAAAKIVKATVSQLVAQVLVQGGDPEGIMNKHVRTVRICSNHIVRTAEAIVRDRVNKMEASKKRVGNLMVQKLNAQTVVNEKRKELQDNEQAVYKFRKQIAKK